MNELLRRYGIESQNGSKLKEVREMLISPDVLTVFDFDHTLFNTSSFHKESFHGALRAVERPLEITPELREKIVGRDDEYAFGILLGATGEFDKTLILRAINEREKILKKMVEASGDLTVYFMKGIPDVIRSLRASGKKVGIASASPDSFVQEFVTRVNVDGTSISDVFGPEAIVGGTTVRSIRNALSVNGDVPPLDKPNPFSIVYAAERANGKLAYPILYIGDEEMDALSVRGRDRDIVGLIVNEKKHDILRKEFEIFKNIVVVKSVLEVLNNE